MSSIDFLDYFLVKERLVDLSYRENLQVAKNGDPIDKVISDLYLARKLIYQRCKSADSLENLDDILNALANEVPEIGLIFNKTEFDKAWKMTIAELKDKFNTHKDLKR